MSSDQSFELLRRLVGAAALISAPIMVATLIVGVTISVLQVATQLQEMTLSYAPKLVAAAVVLIIAGPWMLAGVTRFAAQMFALIPSLG